MSPISKLAAFVREFLPEQWPQLLFPLASFLLLLGTSYPWYHLSLAGFEPDKLAKSAEATRAMRTLDFLARSNQVVPQFLVRFGFFASLVLWTLPVRKVVLKFELWVAMPVGMAVVGYPTFLAITARHRNALLESFAKLLRLQVSVDHWWVHSLADGCYLSLVGLSVLAVGLILVRRTFVSLPVRFRGSREAGDSDIPGKARDVFVFLIGTMILATIASAPLLFAAVLRMQIPLARLSVFPILGWGIASLDAVAAACLALFLFRDRRRQIVARFLKVPLSSDCVLAMLLPVCIILVPRFFLKALELHLVATPFTWSEMLVPGPVPWIFLVYFTAFFAELGIRGYLQTILERRFSLKRAIFLTGLLWGLLPLSFGIVQTFPFGVSAFVRSLPTTYLPWFAMLVVYSVPLGWLYARTRSIIPVALMHGTIALLHLGEGYEIHINHPQLYWAELGLWVLTGWYMFRRHPIHPARDRSVQREPT
ncbi:MAG: lysostaphin resistance A-like protein [Candidatus Acidiferrales bacterium]